MPTRKRPARKPRRPTARRSRNPSRPGTDWSDNVVERRARIWYVGKDPAGGVSVFKSKRTPTPKSHGHRFVEVVGPLTLADAHEEKRHPTSFRRR